MEENASKELAPVASMKKILYASSVQEQFRNAMSDAAPLFVASLIDLYSNDSGLQKCNPADVVKEALKAATLRLPINRNLGFAWIIPYWSNRTKSLVPQFQIGWKGIVQLAQRTGQYRHINCGPVYEGELRGIDKLSGEVDINGVRSGDTVIGYFAFIQTVNGFAKSSYWPKEKVESHAIRYNQECKKAGKLVGNWAEYFDERAQATALKHLISKYGIMSIEFARSMPSDEEDEETSAQSEIDSLANQTVIHARVVDSNPKPEQEEEAPPPPRGPDF